MDGPLVELMLHQSPDHLCAAPLASHLPPAYWLVRPTAERPCTSVAE